MATADKLFRKALSHSSSAEQPTLPRIGLPIRWSFFVALRSCSFG